MNGIIDKNSNDPSNEICQKHYLGNILKYILATKGIAQKDLAQELGISKFKINRLIKQNYMIDLNLWEQICLIYNINFDAIQTGCITTHDKNHDFIIKEFAPNMEHLLTFGPVTRMHTSIFKKMWGEKYFDNYCIKNNINPLLFVNANNPADLDLTLRLLQHSIINGKINGIEGIKEYAISANHYDQQFGKYRYLYSHLDGVNKLKELIINLYSKYEQNHTYNVESMSEKNNWIEMSFYPNEHVNLKLYKEDPILENCFEHFVQAYASEVVGDKTIIEKKESIFNGGEKCIFRITRIATQAIH